MNKKEKQLHGEPKKIWEKLGLEGKSPVDCSFNIGDQVIYTNYYGVTFDAEIIGYSSDDLFYKKYGKFIHIGSPGGDIDGWAWWFPQSIEELTHKE